MGSVSKFTCKIFESFGVHSNRGEGGLTKHGKNCDNIDQIHRLTDEDQFARGNQKAEDGATIKYQNGDKGSKTESISE